MPPSSAVLEERDASDPRTVRLRAWMRHIGAPALSVRLLRGGAPLFQRDVGQTDARLGSPLAPHHRFRLGCLVKPMVAQAVLQLERRGLVELRASIADYVPALDASAFRAITVEHLLTQASGLARGFFQPGPVDAERTLERIVASRLHFLPGTRRKYSHWGYFLLGLVIEAATGQGPEAFIAEQILHPLGLTRCGFDGDRDAEMDLVRGYWSGWRFGAPDPDAPACASELVRIPNCAGGLIGSSSDVARWLDALLAEGRAAAGEAYRPVVTRRVLELRARRNQVFTLGGFCADVLERGACLHFGAFSSGYSCFAFLCPKLDLVGVAVCSHQSGADSLRLLMSELCREFVTEVSLPPTRVSGGAARLGLSDLAESKEAPRRTKRSRVAARPLAADLAALPGVYRCLSMGLCEVVALGDHLFMDFGASEPVELRPRRGRLRFTLIGGPFRLEVVEFFRDPQVPDVIRGLTLNDMAFERCTRPP